jgi:hypothetical protein
MFIGAIMTEKWGSYAFLIGIIIAIIAGAYEAMWTLTQSTIDMVSGVLVILGLVIGLLNITRKESTTFLIAVIALVVASGAGLGNLPIVGGLAVTILKYIGITFAPAAVIVAIKTVWETAKKK